MRLTPHREMLPSSGRARSLQAPNLRPAVSLRLVYERRLLIPPTLPRQLKLPAPDALTRRPRLLLPSGIAPLAVARPIERVSVGYKPASNVLPRDGAARHDPSIAVIAGRHARYGAPAYVVGQRECCFLAAPIRGGSIAHLPSFRCVDAVQPYALAVDFQRIAINDSSLPLYGKGRRGG